MLKQLRVPSYTQRSAGRLVMRALRLACAVLLLVFGLAPFSATPARADSLARVILIPGVEPNPLKAADNFSAQARGIETFGDVMQVLEGNGYSQQDFRYYSYSPTWDIDGGDAYIGSDTHQHLRVLARQLGDQIRHWGVGNGERYEIVGHSLGGTVAAYWAGTETDSTTLAAVHSVVTLDSPINGMITSNPELADAAQYFTFAAGAAGDDLTQDNEIAVMRHAQSMVDIFPFTNQTDAVVPVGFALWDPQTFPCLPALSPCAIPIPFTWLQPFGTHGGMRHFEILHRYTQDGVDVFPLGDRLTTITNSSFSFWSRRNAQLTGLVPAPESIMPPGAMDIYWDNTSSWCYLSFGICPDPLEYVLTVTAPASTQATFVERVPGTTTRWTSPELDAPRGSWNVRLIALWNDGVGTEQPAASSFTIPPPPLNDDFANARVLVPDQFAGGDRGVTWEATTQSAEPSPSCAPSLKTVWYQMTPQDSGTWSVSTHGSSFDTVLAIYQGAAPESLRELTCNDDGDGTKTSSVNVSVSSGQTYYLQLGGFGGDNGAFVLNSSITTATQLVANAHTPGRAWGWGNDGPNLGADGTYVRPTMPAPWAGLTHVIATAGGNSTGNGFIALTADGRVSWLTTFGTASVDDPDHVLNGVVAIAAGGDRYLALRNDGTVWAWGHGYLGTLSVDDITWTPAQVVGPLGAGHLNGITSIAAGASSSYAVAHDGSVFAWGQNAYGEIGNGTRDPAATPVHVLSSDGTELLKRIQRVAAGGAHALALDTGGRVWAWGSDTYGELGDSRVLPVCSCYSALPLQVTRLPFITSLATGAWASFAVSASGSVYAWGGGGNGALGNGMAGDQHFPARINLPVDIAQVSAGWGHVLALGVHGELWAWGDNAEGQVGIGHVSSLYVPEPPTQISLPGSIELISAADHGSLAVVADDLQTVSITVEPGSPATMVLPNNWGQIDFPADLVTVPTTFVFTTEETPTGALRGIRFAGRAFTLNAVDPNGFPVKTFGSRYRIKLEYANHDWQQAGIEDERQLNLDYRDVVNQRWIPTLPCAGCSQDLNAHQLIVELDHLTEFALLGPQDKVPPNTIATVSGKLGQPGWYVTAVSVHLDASDTAAGSGVGATYFSVDDAGCRPIAVAACSTFVDDFQVQQGIHTLRFFSRDRSGNVESQQSLQLQVDTSAPQVSASLLGGSLATDGRYLQSPRVVIASNDAPAGIARVRFVTVTHGTQPPVDSDGTWQTYAGPFTLSPNSDNDVYVSSADLAGNTTGAVLAAQVQFDTDTGPTGDGAGDQLGATPEVDSLLLLGAGLVGLAGYAQLRIRYRAPRGRLNRQ